MTLGWVTPLRSLAHVVTFTDPLNQKPLKKKHPGVIHNYQGVRHILSGKNTEEVYLNASVFQLFKRKPSREVILYNLWISFNSGKLLLAPVLCGNCALLLQKKQRCIEWDCCTLEVHRFIGRGRHTLNMYSPADSGELQNWFLTKMPEESRTGRVILLAGWGWDHSEEVLWRMWAIW